MAIIRNWILENAESDEILMVDDDVSVIGYFEGKRKTKLDEDQVYQFVNQAFRMCREAGTVLWGLNLLNDKMAYREYSPFSLRSVVLGPFMGIVRCGIRFDARLGLKEDYDYSLQVLNKFRKILRFNKYHYAVGHLVGKGGCTSYRTTGKELEQRESFVRKWGSKIVRFKGRDVNPVINVPVPGI